VLSKAPMCGKRAEIARKDCTCFIQRFPVWPTGQPQQEIEALR
jgi:hypothetical protein